jgi:hypothetical protein
MAISNYYILWATSARITNYGIYTSKETLNEAIKQKGLKEYHIEEIKAGKVFEITID